VSSTDKNICTMPVNWKLIKLSDIALVQGGHAFKSTDYRKDGIPLLRISNIKKNKVTFDKDVVFLNKKYLSEHKEYIL